MKIKCIDASDSFNLLTEGMIYDTPGKPGDYTYEIPSLGSRISGWFHQRFQIMDGIVPSPMVSTTTDQGALCGGCGNFNPYAEPNKPDGSHICYSCKSSGRG